MPMMYINVDEMQYGIKGGCIDQSGLTGTLVGTNDYIIEGLLYNYTNDTSLPWTGLNNVYYFIVGTTDILVLTEGLTKSFSVAPGPTRNFKSIFRNTFHFFYIGRATTATMFVNGHNIATMAKVAHNVTTNRIRLGGTGYQNFKSVGCMFRLYLGDFSGFSNAQLLAIHRKNVATPFVNLTELLPYMKFCWRGRKANGSQILDSSGTIENEVNGETLAIQEALAWGQIKAPIWVPR